MSLTVTIRIDPTAFNFLGLDIQWYGIIIAFGGILAYVMYTREGKRFNLDSDMLLDVLFWAVLAGLIGARLYYVAFNLDYYLRYPLEIINVRAGGMAIYGGVIGGMIGAYIVTKRYRQPLIQLLDIAAPALMLAQSVGRWGNFVNQEAYGGIVSRAFLERLALPQWLIEQMYIDGAYYHPTFLYESLWNILGVLLLILLRSRKHLLREGDLAALYMLWYGVGRSWIEGLRTDSLYLGPLRVSQALSVILVIIGIAYIGYNHHKQWRPYYSEGRKA